MSTFSEALEHAKKGLFIKPEELKNESKIQSYKNRFYWNVNDVRVPYVATNKHLFSTKWVLL